MTSRLLVAALLLCQLTAVAQTQFGSFNGPIQKDKLFFFFDMVEPVDLSQPIGAPQHKDAGQQLLDGVSRYKPDNAFKVPTMFQLDNGISIPLASDGSADAVCFTMRSYVVARDSKDSESVHLTHYSTCQMASKYRLKTTELKSGELKTRELNTAQSPDVIRPTSQP